MGHENSNNAQGATPDNEALLANSKSYSGGLRLIERQPKLKATKILAVSGKIAQLLIAVLLIASPALAQPAIVLWAALELVEALKKSEEGGT